MTQDGEGHGSAEKPKPGPGSTWIPLLLVAIFVLPIALAWLYASGFLTVEDGGLLNRGELLEPPITLSANDSTRRLLSRAKLEPGEWAVLYVHAGQCDLACVEDMSKLLTIRSILGADGDRVEVLGLSDVGEGAAGQDNPHSERIIADRVLYETLTAKIRSRDRAAVFPSVAFFDWRGQMMMKFKRDASSRDIKKDLQRLLRASRLR